MNISHRPSCVARGWVQGRVRPAFTLVEILIVVVILGILAAIVLPGIADATNGSQQTTFVTNLTQFHKAGQVFMAETGEFLPDANSGDIPAGLETYIRDDDWLNGTPIGGVWDVEANTGGVRSSLGVHFNDAAENKGDAYMQEIDAMLDDGDLATGGFRKLADARYYLVLAP